MLHKQSHEIFSAICDLPPASSADILAWYVRPRNELNDVFPENSVRPRDVSETHMPLEGDNRSL